MTEMNNEQLEEFKTKLDGFRETLNADEKEVYDAMRLITWHMCADEDDLDLGFDRSFKPEEAALLVSYSSSVHGTVQGMVRGQGLSIHVTGFVK